MDWASIIGSIGGFPFGCNIEDCFTKLLISTSKPPQPAALLASLPAHTATWRSPRSGWYSASDQSLKPAPGLPHPLFMPKIHVPTPLRQYTGKQADIEVQAGTVGTALSDLVAKHPDLKRHLYTEDGKLRSFVNVYLNDEDVRYLQKEATAVKDSDSISIVPSIAGGK